MQKGETDYKNNGYKASPEYKEVLGKVANTAIPGHRKTGNKLLLKINQNGNKSDRGLS